MKRVSYYHAQSGAIFHQTFIFSDESSVDLNRPTPDYLPIEGHYDHLSQRVDITTGTVIDYISERPTEDHVWDVQIKRWVLKPEVVAARLARINALEAIELSERPSLRAIRELVLELAWKAGHDSEAARLLREADQTIAEQRKRLNTAGG